MQEEQGCFALPSSVMVVDDHDIVRFGMETLVRACSGLRWARAAASLAEALELIATQRPDVVICDMGIGDSSGLDTVRALVAAQAPRPLLVMSVHDEMLYGEQAIALGARGYVMKENAYAQVIPAVQAVLAGRIWAAPRLNARLVSRAVRAARTAPAFPNDAQSLSERELKILELLKSGRSTKGIATAMDVSVRSVDSYRARIKRKLGLRTGAELIAFASSRL